MGLMKNERIILAGGGGFLGTLLARELGARGAEVIILARNPSQRGGGKEVHWDGRNLGQWAEHLNGACAVVNLTGRSVNCRYTPENRREIVESRVESVKVIGEAIRRCAQPPRVVVQTSSLAIYGDTGERWCD